MKFILVEIYKFFRINIWKIIIGTIVIAGLFVLNNYRSNIPMTENVPSENEEAKLTVESDPGHFRFYIENEDGDAFTNHILLSQYITHNKILREASIETDTNLDDIVEQTDNIITVNYNESGESKVIGVTKDTNSHLFEFYVNVGNETDNLKIANFFYEYITDDNVPFLSNKSEYIFIEPKIKNYDDDLTFDSEDTTPSSTRNIIKDIIIGIILGMVIVTGVLLILTFLSTKLRYSFSYSLKEDDYFFLVDGKLDYTEELNQILESTSSTLPAVILEDNIEITNKDVNEKIIKLSQNKEPSIYSSLINVDNLKSRERLIYIIQENQTSRNWYNKQRRMDRTYGIPTIVLQVNN